MLVRPSPNFGPRPADVAVDVLVLHYTGMRNAETALRRLCDPAAKVSAHYVIDEDGTVIALVPEDRRAWHAGVSWWRGRDDVNARSIGVELVNPGHEFGYRTFPEAQMAALVTLARDILTRYPIEARNIVGHSDVAPGRKTDPGELFDWPRLAAAGIGLWPADARPAPERRTAPDIVATALTEFGYRTDDLEAAVNAFQRHFRPAVIDGVADAETVGRLDALLEMCRGPASA